MNKKLFHISSILLLVTLIVSACGGTSKPETFTIGVVNVSASLQPVFDSFKAGLAEAGYVEGQNVTYIYDGPVNADVLPALFESLKEKKVNLILSLGTAPTTQAKKSLEGTDIPVVFAPVADPVKSGIVADLLKPGSNITGVQSGSSSMAKRLEWLITVAPNIKRIDVIHNPDDNGSVQGLAALTEVAGTFNVELEVREAHTPDEITAALGAMPEDVDAIFVLSASTLTAHIDAFIKASIENKLPLAAPTIGNVNAGALTSFGWESNALGRQVARLADQILRGVKPADLPVETADSVLGLNLKTANLIGLNVPDEVIRQAKVIVR